MDRYEGGIESKKGGKEKQRGGGTVREDTKKILSITWWNKTEKENEQKREQHNMETTATT